MCLFRTEEENMTVLTDLLQGKDDFPLPVTDEFGGDVVVGWRSWAWTDGNKVRSSCRAVFWYPGDVISAGTNRGDDTLKPSLDTGRGIYCHGSKGNARGEGMRLFGEVALWGTVLDFRGGKKEGAMGQFGYPLSFYSDPRHHAALIKQWEGSGVEIYDRWTDKRVA